MHEESFDPSRTFAVLLFQLPPDLDKQAQLQEQFLEEHSFWKPFIGRLTLWARPFAVTKTETPDDQPALALLVDFSADENFLKEIAYDIADTLESPAYTIVATELDEEQYVELTESPPPWKHNA